MPRDFRTVQALPRRTPPAPRVRLRRRRVIRRARTETGAPGVPTRAGSAPPSATIASIAVLPLANLTGAAGKFFVDGMTEALIATLAQVRASASSRARR